MRPGHCHIQPSVLKGVSKADMTVGVIGKNTTRQLIARQQRRYISST